MPVLVVGLLIGVFVVLAWPAPGSGGGTRPEAPAVATAVPTPVVTPVVTRAASVRVEAHAALLLGAWDRRRAAAWAVGDRDSLSALYVPGSRAGAADVAMLDGWTGRGLTVRHLTTQLLGVRVLARGPRRWVLRVRDRVTGGVAAGAALTEPLSSGSEMEREIVLHRRGGSWRVASVRPVPAAGPR